MDITNFPNFDDNFNIPPIGYDSVIQPSSYPNFENFYANYLYSHLTYYWKLLQSYRNRINYLQNIIDDFQMAKCNDSDNNVFDSKFCPCYITVKNTDNSSSNNELNKTNTMKVMETDMPISVNKKIVSNTNLKEISYTVTENPVLKTENDNIDLYYSTVEDCDVEITSLPTPYNDNPKFENKNKDIRDTVARLRLIGLSFLDMGHLLLHDDPRHPIIPKSNIRNVEYQYPPADES